MISYQDSALIVVAGVNLKVGKNFIKILYFICFTFLQTLWFEGQFFAEKYQKFKNNSSIRFVSFDMKLSTQITFEIAFLLFNNVTNQMR